MCVCVWLGVDDVTDINLNEATQKEKIKKRNLKNCPTQTKLGKWYFKLLIIVVD